jgi:DNA ligase D-like protein (predicted 3'-phosphoesterase)
VPKPKKEGPATQPARKATRAPDRGKLRTYPRKRDFAKTSEPRGRRRRTSHKPRFVVQQHDATTRHWDFRLEAGRVLASWAVPKGPSLNPSDKRMAMRTEDHPLEYADFEGTIPEGEYGAGPIIVWDRGTYRNLTKKDGTAIPVEDAIRDGHVTVWLKGEKLAGGFALTRVAKAKRERWLLVKVDDKKADRRRNPVRTEPRSVVSGRTVDEVA